MPRLLLTLALISALVLGTAGCGSSGDDSGGGTQVLKAGEAIGMQSLRFKPDHVQVPVGQKVTWRNDDSVAHDVKADSGAQFASETFTKDKSYSWTPAAAGTIKYECTLHPGMTGTIDVVAK
jgi:plastocyanin